MKSRWLPVILVLLLCLSLFPAAAGAANTPSFTMNLLKDNQAVGQMVTISVDGSGLTDMYGFELKFKYDSKKLKLLSVQSNIQGFSINPIKEKDEIVFAHTKTGAIAGENGKLTLCTLTFEALAEGRANIQLTGAKLVDSKLKATQPTANFQLVSNIGKQTVRPQFNDIGKHWAKGNIERAIDLGIVNGYSDGTFKPDRIVTRAEFAVMLVKALGLTTEVSAASSFTDGAKIPSWARPYAEAAANKGIIKGYGDGSFRASNPITRAEMTVMLTRVLNPIIDPERRTTFTDHNQIPAWAEPSIAAAVEIGLVQGRGGNRFAPNESATRAEAVTLVLNMLDRLVVEAGDS